MYRLDVKMITYYESNVKGLWNEYYQFAKFGRDLRLRPGADIMKKKNFGAYAPEGADRII